MSSTPRLRLGQLLVDAKLITEEDLQEVLALQKMEKSLQGSDGRRLGALLVERGLINETQLTQILSHQLSIPWVSLLHIEFSRQLLNLVPHDVAERYCLVPIYVRHVRHQGETLYVAMDDPTNEDGLRACREHSGLPVRAMIAPPSDIRSAIRVYYGVKSVAPSRPAPELVDTQPTPTIIEAPISSSRLDNESRPTLPEIPMSVKHQPLEVEEAAPPPAAARMPSAPPPPESSPSPRLPSSPPARRIEEDAPDIEVSEPAPKSWRGGPTPAERLRGILHAEPVPPSSSREVETIPKPRGRAPRMVALTLLDGTTLNLPAAGKRGKRVEAEPAPAPPAPKAPPVEPPPVRRELPTPADDALGLTARDLVLALRAVANGADASEVLGNNVRWEGVFAALLSLMLKKHLIADWEFVDELKKTM